MAPIRTPEESPRLFDMVRFKEESVRPAFYFALRDTLVAQDMEQATRIAFQKDRRRRVVTLKGQIIEIAGKKLELVYVYLAGQFSSCLGILLKHKPVLFFLKLRNHDRRWKSDEGQDGLLHYS